MSQAFILETDDGEEFEVNTVPGKATPITTFGPDKQRPDTDFITTPGTLWTVYKGVRVLVSDLRDGRFRLATRFGDKIARRKEDR